MGSLAKNQLATRLVEKTGCTQEQASLALEQGDGSLLDAMLYLESRGQALPCSGLGEYSTQHRSAQRSYDSLSPLVGGDELPPWTWRHFFLCLKKELFENFLKLWYKETGVIELPMAAVVLLVPITYGVVLLILLISLFFGASYQFTCKESVLYPLNRELQELTIKCHGYWQRLNWKG